jgi:hypothetical protein
LRFDRHVEVAFGELQIAILQDLWGSLLTKCCQGANSVTTRYIVHCKRYAICHINRFLLKVSQTSAKNRTVADGGVRWNVLSTRWGNSSGRNQFRRISVPALTRSLSVWSRGRTTLFRVRISTGEQLSVYCISVGNNAV